MMLSNESIQSAVPELVVKFSIRTVLLAASVVNAPVDLTVAPTLVPFIVPPVIVTPLDVKSLAVTSPNRFIVSNADPILTMSARVSFVAIFMTFPPAPVPI